MCVSLIFEESSDLNDCRLQVGPCDICHFDVIFSPIFIFILFLVVNFINLVYICTILL